MGLLVLIAAYLLGGLTFIPLVLWVGIVVGTRKIEEGSDAVHGIGADEGGKKVEGSTRHGTKNNLDADWGVDGLEDIQVGVLDGLKRRTHVPDVAAGYFAVCREYVPGGINGKPPERTTPAGSVIAAESPSVYQSMYRSIFDRNKSFTPTLDGANGKSKRARNIFYVVLRLGHLMLYDDSEQLEVRHVISLTHYDICVYAGGEPIPEGELWIKRNCIRLTQRPQTNNIPSDSKPFYMFSENCSEKEDFYHAMLQSLERRADEQESPPIPLKFDTSDLVKLVQQLHASEENLHTRWINALIGRLFLAMYKTSEVERFLWTKITKKIARVPKPALITSIKLQKVDMGNLPPFITNPKLKELTVDGDLTVEADVSYKGNLSLEIAAIARIELGTRFKAREVTLVLASILKSLEGHILVRIKPPPSNRIWITFESAPRMELSLEPIVSSRQITYGVILRAIESRIREVVSETLVLPNWDDIPFSDTMMNQFRGGIWTDTVKDRAAGYPHQENSENYTPFVDIESEEIESQASSVASSEAMKSVSGSTTSSRRHPASPSNLPDTESTGISSSIDIRPPSKPKAMRSGSFASAASPIVNMNPANASVSVSEERKRQHDATSAMKTTISKSQQSSPAESPVGSPSNHDARRSTSPASFQRANRVQGNDFDPPLVAGSASLSSLSPKTPGTPNSTTGNPPLKSRHGTSMSLPRNTFGSSSEKRQSFNQSLNSATAVAKKWLASRQNPDLPPSPMSGGLFSRAQTSSNVSKTTDDEIQDFLNGTNSQPSSSQVSVEITPPLGSPAHPIGRGQPLPPPGTPLPHPPKSEKRTTWSVPAAATFANLTRRKPVSTRQAQPQPHSQLQSTSQSQSQAIIDSESLFEPSSSPSSIQQAQHEATPPGESVLHSRRKPSSTQPILPPLPKRRQRLSVTDTADRNGRGQESLFVVEAPAQENSAPTSPADFMEREREGSLNSVQNEGGKGSEREGSVNSVRKEDVGEEEGGVFQGMEMDDGLA
ncbi:hypothetical protein K505DRAFT_283211 [Melanomma pulvis-pyrius CBS 109.77]|uniref:SMP-LTD domain-containing protein n=1 Tax=Melanomma pulvis-pyrius CBS 109.77 TaxID=1314802 RepID=A0A6A6X2G1_9PLEO|nr:hypothetical protein K505DRAFT_283211 [Melanomma pulvis-pyrius CBS 109.77]